MEDLIQQRAYTIWEREGRPHGRAEEHWRMAAAEIAAEQAETQTPKRRSGKRASKQELDVSADDTTPNSKRKTSGKSVREVAGEVIDAAVAGVVAVLKPKRQPRKVVSTATAFEPAASEPATAGGSATPKRRSRKAAQEVPQAVSAEPVDRQAKPRGRKAAPDVWSPADIATAANGAKPRGRRKGGEPAPSIH